ncbi:MAG: cytochrome-c oxidase, cbb3-type subunit III, partial [Paracoccaceae bacterium]
MMAENDKDKPVDPHTDPANPDNRISLERRAPDSEHAAKIAGAIPERARPDQPVSPRKRKQKGRKGL